MSNLEEKVEELAEKVEKLEKENRELKSRLGEQETGEKDGENEEITRRDFLKGIGAGAASIGALSLIPSAASKIKITDSGITKDGSQTFWNQGNLVKNNFLQTDGSTSMSGNLSLGGNSLETGGGNITVFDSTNNNNLMKMNEGGPVEILNTNLDLNQNQARRMVIDTYTSDPSAVEGQIWYRSDL